MVMHWCSLGPLRNNKYPLSIAFRFHRKSNLHRISCFMETILSLVYTTKAGIEWITLQFPIPSSTPLSLPSGIICTTFRPTVRPFLGRCRKCALTVRNDCETVQNAWKSSEFYNLFQNVFRTSLKLTIQTYHCPIGHVPFHLQGRRTDFHFQ